MRRVSEYAFRAKVRFIRFTQGPLSYGSTISIHKRHVASVRSWETRCSAHGAVLSSHIAQSRFSQAGARFT